MIPATRKPFTLYPRRLPDYSHGKQHRESFGKDAQKAAEAAWNAHREELCCLADKTGERAALRRVGALVPDNAPPGTREIVDGHVRLYRGGTLPMTRRGAYTLRDIMERHQMALRFNERTGDPEFRFWSESWKPLDSHWEGWFIEWCAERFNVETKNGFSEFRWTKRNLETALAFHLRENRVDPFKEWLTDCYKEHGNNESGIWTIGPGNWLYEAFDIKDDQDIELVDWVSRYILLATVCRAFEPGCVADVMPVLVGKTNIGKDLTFQHLLPVEEMPYLHATGLKLDAQHERLVSGLRGRAFAVVSEMTGSTTADINWLKDFITTKDDGAVRLPYAPRAVPLPRRFVMIGLSNAGQPIPNDPTGTRRWVVVKLSGRGELHPKEFGERYRRMLWGKVVKLYYEGERPELPDWLSGRQAAANREYVRSDEVLMAQIEDAADEIFDNQPLRLADIMAKINMPENANKREQGRLAVVLREMGFSQSRPWRGDGGGPRPAVWEVPVDWYVATPESQRLSDFSVDSGH